MQFSVGNGHLKGRVRWAVLNADGSFANGGTLEPDAPSSNLILDQGIDNLDANFLAELFQNCAVGTGTSTPATTQVELDNEKGRTNNYVNDLCDTTFPADGSSPYTVTMKRGFDFPQGSLDSSTDGDYTELGFSQDSSAGQNLFSRALIKDENDNTISVTVASDQILRIAYELDVTYEPSSQTSGTVDITNIGTIGYTALGAMFFRRFWGCAIAVVNDSGGIDTEADSYFVFEPSRFASISEGDVYTCALASNDPAWHSGFYSSSDMNSVSSDGKTKAITKTYNGSGVWDFTITFATDQGNVTGVKNIYLGWADNKGYPGVRFRIDDGDEFDKQNTHELVLTFEISFTAN